VTAGNKLYSRDFNFHAHGLIAGIGAQAIVVYSRGEGPNKNKVGWDDEVPRSYLDWQG
jgi:hypothetical protein